MNDRQEFTIALKDLFSSRIDKISAKSDKEFRRVQRDIDGVGRSSKQAAFSIADIDRRLDALRKVRRLSIDTSAIKAANREIAQLETKKAGMEGMGGGRGMGLGGFAAIATVAYGVGSFIKSSAQLAMQNEQNAVSFEVLLGSAGKADKMLRNIADFSAKTPFRKLEVTDAAQALLGYGVNAEKVLPVLNQLGDVSRGNSEVFKRVVENYGKAVSAQRMRTEDINQFAEAGIPMWAELEKITGKSGQALRKYVETNGISVDQMNQAFASMTGEGGKFHNMMQKQSQTTTGKISTLADNFDELKMAAGNRMKPTLDGAVNALSGMVDRATKWMTIPVTEQLGQQQAKMNMLVRSVTDYNLGEDERKSKLAELQAAYPEYFGNIDTETIKNEELLGILNDVNAAYSTKIEAAASKAAVDAMQQEIDKATALYNQLDQAKMYMQLYKESGNEMYKEMYDRVALPEKMMYDLDKKRAAAEHESFVTMSQLKNEDSYKQIKVEKERIVSVFNDIASNSSEALQKHFAGNMNQMVLFKEMAGELLNSSSVTNAFKNSKFDEGTVNIFRSISGLIGAGDTNTPGATTGGMSNTGASGLGSGITDVSGDRVAQKNVTINITNLIEGGFTISSTNMQEGAGQAKDIVVQALLDAVNDANYVAQ